MKVTTLIEDKKVDNKNLKTEHGFSAYIEVDGKNILFDTGQSGDFIDNAKELDIDLKKLDYLLMSHGHFDHSGGFKRLIKEIDPDLQVLVGQGFFNEKYNLTEDGSYDYKGNSFDEDFLRDNSIDFQYIEKDITNLTEDLMVFTNFDRDEAFENTDNIKYIKKDGKYIKDEFLEEISLGIKTSKGLLVIVGCSHPGIVNILDTIIDRTGMDIYGVIGGTHLLKEKDEKINRIVDYLKEKDIKLVGFGHCTGDRVEEILAERLKESFISNRTGDVIED